MFSVPAAPAPAVGNNQVAGPAGQVQQSIVEPVQPVYNVQSSSSDNKLQQNQWGYVDEQKKIDEDCLCSLEKISFFLKNIS